MHKSNFIISKQQTRYISIFKKGNNMPLLTEQKLRILVQKEIENSDYYKNLSPKQKQLLEEGVVGKVLGAIKGAFQGFMKGLAGENADPKAVAARKAMAAELQKFQQQRIAVYNKMLNYYNTYHKKTAEAKYGDQIKQALLSPIYNTPNETIVTEVIEILNQ